MLREANPDTGAPKFEPALKKMVDENKSFDLVTLEAAGPFEICFRSSTTHF